jgi:hypothetical protein
VWRIFMSNEADPKPRSERHIPFWVGLIPVLALVAVTYGAVRYATQDDENPTFAPAAIPESTPFAYATTTSQPVGSTPNTQTIYDNGIMGKVHPYTHLFYPSVTPPPGFEGYDCYGVPQDGTVFGTMLLGGTDDHTLTDITSGVFFKGGVQIEVDLTKPSAEWTNLQLVHFGDFGCSQ